jgi:hypothetical protein
MGQENNSYNVWTVHGVSETQIVKVNVKVTLEQPTKAQRGSRGIALLFL